MQRQTDDRFGQIFEIALVLLGVLSAAEYDFLKEVWGSQYAFKLVTAPIAITIVVWLAKEISKDHITTEKWLWYTEFSWTLWLLTLSYYQFFSWVIQLPQIAFVIVGIIIVMGGVLALYWLISRVYRLMYEPVVPDFYRTKKWLVKRFILNLAAIGVISVIFGIPPTING